METLQVTRVERRPQPQVDNEVDSAPSAQVRIIYMIGIVISLLYIYEIYFPDYIDIEFIVISLYIYEIYFPEHRSSIRQQHRARIPSSSQGLWGTC